ncbi:hypothetical protein [Enorma massiliensis]|uniref:hypothetical protein n=1 Tax=Enorma massiliensis TaxID=1472761 RepID=UPI003A8CFFE3
MAPLEGEAGGHARAGAHVQEARRRLLADLAHAGADGRGPPGLFVDGIWLARDLVVLIAYDGGHVASWYMAESETSRAWEALMAPIPAPEVVACDGGAGFEKAGRRAWPGTRVQRCLFHAFSQVRRYTTSRPRLQAGRELYALAIELMHVFDSLRIAGLSAVGFRE